MHHVFERRNVVAGADRGRQFQQTAEHGRHELAVGDPVLFNQREIGLGSNFSMMMLVPPLRMVRPTAAFGAE